MLGTYRSVFRTPGTGAFCGAGFVARLPLAIYPIALVLLISLRTHHYAFGGVLSACYILGGAPGNPFGAVLVDRFGQGRVLVPAALVHIAAVAAIIAIVEAGASEWWETIPATVAGFSFLSIGSLVRARWSHVLAGRPELSTAYSLESTLDEAVFLLGPLLATLLATELDPVAPLIAGAALVIGGSLWMARLTDTEPPVHEHEGDRPGTALRERGMVLVLFASIAMGAVFSSTELSMVAFSGQHGHANLSGVVLAVFALGSGLAGLLYGSRTWRGSLPWRFRLQSSIFALLPPLFLAAVNVPTLAVCAVVVGLSIAPTLITSFGLVAEIVPTRSLTEGLAWLSTGLNIGYGLGAAVVGRLADDHGGRSGFGVSVSAAVLFGVLAWVVYGALRRVPAPLA
ncbi:MAG: MFS transporter [Actinobacteria bacterium]|nr:MFS transporter [Actinomycetota bacterium]